jgi:ornithine carbamoyltransferase
MTRHFLALSQFSRAELDAIFALTRELKEKQKRGIEHRLLAGKTLAMLFEKASTRTRVSFEVGIYQLGGHGLFISSGTSQMGRGEPIKDTARVMSRYCDGVMIRTYGQEIVEEFARYSSVPVINGLTDLFHPCQIMADLFTVIEHRGSYDGLKIAWIGDGNNMANTWIEAAAIFGFDLTLACPSGYAPDSAVLQWAQQRATSAIVLTEDPKEAVRDADVINTDVWASMGQEEEQAVRVKAFAGFQVNEALLDGARGNCMVLHCLPAHRGEEITDDVMEGPHSAVWDEAENRLHVQKAIMATLMGDLG